MSRNKRNVAGEGVGTFMNIQERSEAVSCSMLRKVEYYEKQIS
jgi:hypothetical protein